MLEMYIIFIATNTDYKKIYIERYRNIGRSIDIDILTYIIV